MKLLLDLSKVKQVQKKTARRGSFIEKSDTPCDRPRNQLVSAERKMSIMA